MDLIIKVIIAVVVMAIVGAVRSRKRGAARGASPSPPSSRDSSEGLDRFDLRALFEEASREFAARASAESAELGDQPVDGQGSWEGSSDAAGYAAEGEPRFEERLDSPLAGAFEALDSAEMYASSSQGASSRASEDSMESLWVGTEPVEAGAHEGVSALDSEDAEGTPIRLEVLAGAGRGGLTGRFRLRDAILYDAILRRPYGRGYGRYYGSR